jgi:5-methyltetrahydrofolate--homocysteine methyltransferase
MAFGYPATPDHSLKREAFDLLNAQLMTEMRLTENFMINPGEALCGMMVADEAARYFAVGAIDEEQLKDYAKRRGFAKEQMRKILPKNI